MDSDSDSDPDSVDDAIAAFVGADHFPCVGAKAALRQGRLQVVVAGDLRSSPSDDDVLAQLQAFAARADDEAVFLSLVVVFEDTPRLSEAAFERALWARLQALHARDAPRHRWDPRVSSDPQSATFSMSFGGRAFYVVGLHPGASRPARRFAHAALAFNLHSQFEVLRRDGRYPKLHASIAARDIALCGTPNPMLTAHGVASEARQYSGRVVAEDWVCPFRARAERLP